MDPGVFDMLANGKAEVVILVSDQIHIVFDGVLEIIFHLKRGGGVLQLIFEFRGKEIDVVVVFKNVHGFAADDVARANDDGKTDVDHGIDEIFMSLHFFGLSLGESSFFGEARKKLAVFSEFKNIPSGPKKINFEKFLAEAAPEMFAEGNSSLSAERGDDPKRFFVVENVEEVF